jgi:hypothetical protein
VYPPTPPLLQQFLPSTQEDPLATPPHLSQAVFGCQKGTLAAAALAAGVGVHEKSGGDHFQSAMASLDPAQHNSMRADCTWDRLAAYRGRLRVGRPSDRGLAAGCPDDCMSLFTVGMPGDPFMPAGFPVAAYSGRAKGPEPQGELIEFTGSHYMHIPGTPWVRDGKGEADRVRELWARNGALRDNHGLITVPAWTVDGRPVLCGAIVNSAGGNPESATLVKTWLPGKGTDLPVCVLRLRKGAPAIPWDTVPADLPPREQLYQYCVDHGSW